MYTDLNTFVADLPRLATGLREKLRGQSGRFLVRTDAVTAGLVLEDGALTIVSPEDSPFDVTVSASDSVLLDLVNGKLNPVTAILFGRVRVSGNKGLLLALARCAV